MKLEAAQLAKDYESYKVQKSTSFSGPSQANRCSTLGHPCTAYCYYDRTIDPAHRIRISSHLATIFAEGNDQERNFRRDVLEMGGGWDVSQEQGSVAWKKYNITGHQDFRLSKNGVSVRCEFKSVHPLLWDRLSSVEDVKNHKSYFIVKWYAQVLLYCLLDSQEVYWLILKNKSTGQIKTIVFEWNDEMLVDAENLLKKAESVNKLVQIGGEIPAPLKLADSDICASCEFLTVCNPPLDFGKGVEIIDEETAAELSVLADERAKVEAAKKSFESYDEELKDRIKALAGSEKSQLIFGDWSAAISRQNVKEEKKPRAAFTKTIIKFQKLVVEGQV